MTRLALIAAIGAGIVVGLVLGAALSIHADEQPTDDTLAAAAQAGVSALDLQGAVNATGLDPFTYLRMTGELSPPVTIAPACGWPICGPLGQRLWCIESYESHHNGSAVNRSSGAAGWLQWLPGTARTWGVAIGNRWSEWNAASQIAALGERLFRSQWPINAARC